MRSIVMLATAVLCVWLCGCGSTDSTGSTVAGSGNAAGAAASGSHSGSGHSGSPASTGGGPSTGASSPGGGTTGAGATPGSGATEGQEQPDATVPAEAEAPCTMQVPSSMDCTQRLAPGDERTCMLGTRTYIVYAPKNLDLCKPTALVIDAHGFSETAQEEEGSMQFCAGAICWHGLGSGWKAEADQPGGGFIAVFGQGIGNAWSATDATYFEQVVTDVEKQANIDPKHVYISGISNGGAVTYQTGCPDSDVFHGMSPVSGGSNCTTVKAPIPLIAFDDMPDFAYQGSVAAKDALIQAEHCKGTGTPYATIDKNYPEAVCRSAKEDPMAKIVPCNQVTTADGGDIEPTTCTVWDQCDGNVKVVFCTVAANTEHGAANASLDGHIIYENNTLLNTPSLAWRFFKSFW
jgi:poly(3-hydroxybutyrate) depolymerase